MITVIAIKNFEHHGPVGRGDHLRVSPAVADKLCARGLVVLASARPPVAPGGMSSASPAAQVSPQTTAKRSRRGARRQVATQDVLS